VILTAYSQFHLSPTAGEGLIFLPIGISLGSVRRESVKERAATDVGYYLTADGVMEGQMLNPSGTAVLFMAMRPYM
jgi:hypothetical protein